MYNFLIYLIMMIVVIWAMEGLNINGIFKKNRVYQAKIFYILMVLSITYMSSNFIIEFLNSLKY